MRIIWSYDETFFWRPSLPSSFCAKGGCSHLRPIHFSAYIWEDPGSIRRPFGCMPQFFTWRGREPIQLTLDTSGLPFWCLSAALCILDNGLCSIYPFLDGDDDDHDWQTPHDIVTIPHQNVLHPNPDLMEGPQGGGGIAPISIHARAYTCRHKWS